MDLETISAIATPIGKGGIGIVRLSGPRAISIVDPLLRIGKKSPEAHASGVRSSRSHLLKYGKIVDPRRNQIIDEVLVVVMRAPHSYTREDVVEIQSHSGHVILASILNLVLDRGARLAQPGEFTRRAFLNGRIDLSQAEAVAEVISARSETALQLATTHLGGHMRSAVDNLIEKIVALQVDLEAHIEFPDELEEKIDLASIESDMESKVMGPIDDLLDQYQEGHLLRDGVRLGIVGRPNVGKSSLLNRLVRKEKAIVTPIAGTTRDLIEDQTSIEGLPVLITDTAGLRASTDPIEIVGIQRTRQSIATSDIVLFVVDGSQPFSDEDREVFDAVKERNYILCFNKSDLKGVAKKTTPDAILNFSPSVDISAKTGEGIDALKNAVKDLCLSEAQIDPGSAIVPNLRQKAALEQAAGALNRVLSGMRAKVGEELFVSDLSAARTALEEVIGGHVDGEILDEVFKKFCIGK